MGALIPSTALTRMRVAHIVEHTQAQLYGFVRRLLHDSEEARDVVQDVYVSAWKAATNGTAPFAPESEEAEARKWLFHVAYRKAMSHLRHRYVINWESLDVPLPPEPVELGAAPFENHVVEADMVHATLAKLDLADQVCLTLSVVEGFTSVEIAHILGIAPDATRKRLSRAMQRLRHAYFAHDPDSAASEPAQSARVADTREKGM
jgi:RNA polymerase sigma-70 factor, ECF subfamily